MMITDDFKKVIVSLPSPLPVKQFLARYKGNEKIEVLLNIIGLGVILRLIDQNYRTSCLALGKKRWTHFTTFCKDHERRLKQYGICRQDDFSEKQAYSYLTLYPMPRQLEKAANLDENPKIDESVLVLEKEKNWAIQTLYKMLGPETSSISLTNEEWIKLQMLMRYACCLDLPRGQVIVLTWGDVLWAYSHTSHNASQLYNEILDHFRLSNVNEELLKPLNILKDGQEVGHLSPSPRGATPNTTPSPLWRSRTASVDLSDSGNSETDKSFAISITTTAVESSNSSLQISGQGNDGNFSPLTRNGDKIVLEEKDAFKRFVMDLTQTKFTNADFRLKLIKLCRQELAALYEPESLTEEGDTNRMNIWYFVDACEAFLDPNNEIDGRIMSLQERWDLARKTLNCFFSPNPVTLNQKGTQYYVLLESVTLNQKGTQYCVLLESAYLFSTVFQFFHERQFHVPDGWQDPFYDCLCKLSFEERHDIWLIFEKIQLNPKRNREYERSSTPQLKKFYEEKKWPPFQLLRLFLSFFQATELADASQGKVMEWIDKVWRYLGVSILPDFMWSLLEGTPINQQAIDSFGKLCEANQKLILSQQPYVTAELYKDFDTHLALLEENLVKAEPDPGFRKTKKILFELIQQRTLLSPLYVPHLLNPALNMVVRGDHNAERRQAGEQTTPMGTLISLTSSFEAGLYYFCDWNEEEVVTEWGDRAVYSFFQFTMIFGKEIRTFNMKFPIPVDRLRQDEQLSRLFILITQGLLGSRFSVDEKELKEAVAYHRASLILKALKNNSLESFQEYHQSHQVKAIDGLKLFGFLCTLRQETWKMPNRFSVKQDFFHEENNPGYLLQFSQEKLQWLLFPNENSQIVDIKAFSTQLERVLENQKIELNFDKPKMQITLVKWFSEEANPSIHTFNGTGYVGTSPVKVTKRIGIPATCSKDQAKWFLGLLIAMIRKEMIVKLGN